MGKTMILLVVAIAMTSSAFSQEVEHKSSKPPVAVSDFEFGTIQKWWDGDWNVGKGVADMLVDQLLESGNLRLLERKQLESVKAEQDLAASNRAEKSEDAVATTGHIAKARYIVTGSVTKFGGENKDFGIGGLGGALIGGYLGAAASAIGTRKTTAHVELTVRVVDTTTSEIVASVKSAGQSRRSGLLLGGGAVVKGKVAAGGIQMGSSDFRETILGEATVAAVQDAAAKLIKAISNIREDEQ